MVNAIKKTVVLANGRHDTFRRSVFDKNGERLRTLVFEKGSPVELTGADLKACEKDIGHALLEATLDKKGRARVVNTDVTVGSESADQAIAALESSLSTSEERVAELEALVTEKDEAIA